MTRILHTISSLSDRSGGTSTCTYALVKALNQAGCVTDILTMKLRESKDNMIGDDSFIHAVDNDARTPLGISRNLRRAISKSNYDIYHTNGMWLDTNHATARISQSNGKPYVISPHGMLYPQAMARSSWKKQIMLALGHKTDIALASCVHATCKQEMEYYRSLGFTNPVAIIPNPIVIPDYVSSIQRPIAECFRIGFLGRIHPRKRVHDLISAWSRLGKKTTDGELLIIGQGDNVYMTQLLDQIASLNLRNVKFTGFLSGKEKYQTLASLKALFVPSDFENFGMIIPEALIMGTPVMASLGTPWEDLNTHRCGWWCNNDVSTLATRIEEVISLSFDELQAMGKRGRQLIEQNYTADKVARRMKQLYEHILGFGTNPDFFYE